MSLIKITCLFFLTVLVSNVSAQSDFVIRPNAYTAYKTQDAITIDGKPDELVWDSIEWSSDFIDIEGVKTPKYQTNVKIVWDDTYFYILAKIEEIGDELSARSIKIYNFANKFARERGIIIADTKFEFGRDENGVIHLADEVLTPDSSRFWPLSSWKPGATQLSYDKQFLRDWLTASGWDRSSPPPELPEEIVEKTRERYLEAYFTITGEKFEG